MSRADHGLGLVGRVIAAVRSGALLGDPPIPMPGPALDRPSLPDGAPLPTSLRRWLGWFDGGVVPDPGQRGGPPDPIRHNLLDAPRAAR
jgi:hypothetical protein